MTSLLCPGAQPGACNGSLQREKEGVMKAFFKNLLSQTAAIIVSMLLVGGVIYWLM